MVKRREGVLPFYAKLDSAERIIFIKCPAALLRGEPPQFDLRWRQAFGTRSQSHTSRKPLFANLPQRIVRLRGQRVDRRQRCLQPKILGRGRRGLWLWWLTRRRGRGRMQLAGTRRRGRLTQCGVVARLSLGVQQADARRGNFVQQLLAQRRMRSVLQRPQHQQLPFRRVFNHVRIRLEAPQSPFSWP